MRAALAVLRRHLDAARYNSRENDSILNAKALLAKYISTYHAFDHAVVDLYDDDAVIENTRTYTSGETRKLAVPAAEYKALLRKSLALAKASGDRSRYTQPRFFEEAGAVRIEITRYSELTKATTPMVLLVAPDKSGRWLVVAELTVSVA
jgi:hypothetical protein